MERLRALGTELACGRAVARIDAGGTKATLTDANGRASAPFDLVLDASGAGLRLRDGVGQARATCLPGAVWATVADLGIAPRTLAQRYVEARIIIGYLPVGRIAPDGEAPRGADLAASPTTEAGWSNPKGTAISRLPRPTRLAARAGRTAARAKPN